MIPSDELEVTGQPNAVGTGDPRPLWAHGERPQQLRSLVLVAVLALSACAGDAATPSPRTITGRLTLNSNTVDRNANLTRCEGTGGYADIEQGTGVTLRDGDGNVAGSAQLEVASREEFGNFPGCVYTFTFPDVKPADFYVVEIADRGELTFSAEQLESDGWRIETSLGD